MICSVFPSPADARPIAPAGDHPSVVEKVSGAESVLSINALVNNEGCVGFEKSEAPDSCRVAGFCTISGPGKPKMHIGGPDVCFGKVRGTELGWLAGSVANVSCPLATVSAAV